MVNIQNFENLENFEARRSPEGTTAEELSQMAKTNEAMGDRAPAQGIAPTGTGIETQMAATGAMSVRKELGSALETRQTIKTESGNTFSVDTTEGTQALAAAEAAKQGAQIVAEQKQQAKEMLSQAEQIKNAEVESVQPEIAQAQSEFTQAIEAADAEHKAEHQEINQEENELFADLGAEWASVMG